MRDSIKRLYIEPTSICNLNCKMCFRNSWIDEEQGMMSIEVIDKIYEGIDGDIDKVVFAGMGEPLLHNGICDMVYNISQMNKKTEIITNAMLLNESMSENLIKSGLDFLWVSLDNSHIASELKHSIDVIENIKYFNKIRGNKCKLGFAFVLFRTSSDEIEKINELADDFEADEINLSQIIPCEPIERSCYSSMVPVGKMKRAEFGDNGKAKLNYCPFVGEGCCFIKWNGDVVPCMQLLHSSYTYLYNEKRKVMSYSFGNLNEQNLSDIWNKTEYEIFRKRVMDFEFPDCTLCNGCDDRKENVTDCMYNEMPTCGACLWAQNIARCP